MNKLSGSNHFQLQNSATAEMQCAYTIAAEPGSGMRSLKHLYRGSLTVRDGVEATVLISSAFACGQNTPLLLMGQETPFLLTRAQDLGQLDAFRYQRCRSSRYAGRTTLKLIGHQRVLLVIGLALAKGAGNIAPSQPRARTMSFLAA